jgi:hypothetical protein
MIIVKPTVPEADAVTGRVVLYGCYLSRDLYSLRAVLRGKECGGISDIGRIISLV